MRTKYLENNIEEDIGMKNQYRIRNVNDPISIREAVSKNCVENLFNDPSFLKNTAHVEFNDENLDNVRFVKVISLPFVREDLTRKVYVDDAVSHSLNEHSSFRLDFNEKLKLDEQDSIVPNFTLSSPKTTFKIPIRSYVDSVHENSRNRRDILSVFNG